MGKWPSLDKIELKNGSIGDKEYVRELRKLQHQLLDLQIHHHQTGGRVVIGIDGWDAAVKTAALITVLMGVSVRLEDIEREGIRDLTTEAVRNANYDAILASFNVEAYGKDSAAVIEVTRMFTGGVQELTANGRRATVDATRSFIDRWAAFSKNINVTAQQTYTPQAGGAPAIPVISRSTYSSAFRLTGLRNGSSRYGSVSPRSLTSSA